jgi:hypothetical protein
VRNDSRSRESLRQSGQHRQIRVKLYASKTAHPERSQPEPVFQRSELSLDCRTAPVQVAPPLCFARDERVQTR